MEQKPREQPMAETQEPSTLDLLRKTLEMEFGNPGVQYFGLFGDDLAFGIDKLKQQSVAGAVVASPADELFFARQRFDNYLLHVVEQQLAGLSLDSSVLVVGDPLVSVAKNIESRDISALWLGSADLIDEELRSLSHFKYCETDLISFQCSQKVELLLLQCPFCYLDQLALLSKSRDLLAATGRLLLLGEFLADDSGIGYSMLPSLSSFHNLSTRLGFRLCESVELSESAVKTLSLVKPVIEKHAPALLSENVIDNVMLEDVKQDFALVQSEFDSGRRCFRLFLLDRELEQKSKWANVEYGDIHSFHRSEISTLFEKSFNVTFDEDLWDWKYQRGEGSCVTARLRKGGEIVAHYGGAPRDILYFGTPSKAIQLCDVMVHPDIRKQYGRGSLFFEVAATFLEREIGNTVKHLLGFGFPNKKTMNISKCIGLYEKVDNFIEIEYSSPEGDASVQELKCEAYRQSAIHAEELDSLWLQMCKGYTDSIIGVRDSDYIKYRYLSHPFARSNQYQCLIIREVGSGTARAFAVLKEHPGGKLLMDLICPLHDMKSMISKLNQEVHSPDMPSVLKLWITQSAKEKIWLENAVTNELGIEIPCNNWSPGPSHDALLGAWWLTAGDMDFI